MASEKYTKAIMTAATESGEYIGQRGGWIYRTGPDPGRPICQGWQAFAEKVERISGCGTNARYDNLHQRAIDILGSPAETDEPETKADFDNQTWGKIRWNGATIEPMPCRNGMVDGPKTDEGTDSLASLRAQIQKYIDGLDTLVEKLQNTLRVSPPARREDGCLDTDPELLRRLGLAEAKIASYKVCIWLIDHPEAAGS